ncbi:PIN domain-containing protein [Candidatus Woesearchaeota archaeon]|nr:PIN domain-containing protein [Candidatus Woesearchaeota archaeon]
MQVIIDANVIIAMLVKPGKPIDLFFDSRLSIFAPQLLFEELEQNKEELMSKSSLIREEYEWLLTILAHSIQIIPEQDFLSYREKADKICPDPKDMVYFALALYLNCPIWTNEKKLKEQNDVTIYATHELIRMFEIN